MFEYPGRFRRRGRVAVGENREIHGIANIPDGVVLGLAGEPVSPGPAVDGQGCDIGLLRQSCDAQAVTPRGIGPGPDLQRDGHLHGLHDCCEDLRHQRLIGQQGRAGRLVADLLCRATHVDIDDFRPE